MPKEQKINADLNLYRYMWLARRVDKVEKDLVTRGEAFFSFAVAATKPVRHWRSICAPTITCIVTTETKPCC
jgi:hypothetical protein